MPYGFIGVHGVGCHAVGRFTNDTGLLNHRASIIYLLHYVLLLPFDDVLHSATEEPLRNPTSKRVSSEAWRTSGDIEVKMGLRIARAPKGTDAARTTGATMRVTVVDRSKMYSNQKVNYSAQVDIFSYSRLPL
jgi:hypothetical protein